MVAQHEAQHDETLLQTLQLMPEGAYSPCMGALPPVDEPVTAPEPMSVDGGLLMMGTDGGHGALDCEQPCHARQVAPFRLDRHPVTIGRHLEFMAYGGYGDPRLWSEAGWAWRQQSGAEAPLHWQPDGEGGWQRTWFGCTEALDPAEILCHVSFFEAEAHARWASARLLQRQPLPPAGLLPPQRRPPGAAAPACAAVAGGPCVAAPPAAAPAAGPAPVPAATSSIPAAAAAHAQAAAAQPKDPFEDLLGPGSGARR
jgi:iron(II)-dependent oxidoreductase